MLTHSSPLESLKHSAFGGVLYGTGVAIHQAYYSQSVYQILESASGQFLTTLINGFVNLRLYNFVKQKLSETGLQDISSKIGGGLVSGTETFAFIYIVQSYLGSKHPLSIALFYGALSTFLIPTVYEKYLERNK